MRKRKAGFTLVELLVATLVVSVAFAGVIESVAAMLYLLDLSKSEAVATGDLKNMMEDIRATSFDIVTTLFPNGTVDGPAVNLYSSIVGGYTLTDEHITVGYVNPLADPLELRVTVNWTDRRNLARSVAASTCKTR